MIGCKCTRMGPRLTKLAEVLLRRKPTERKCIAPRPARLGPQFSITVPNKAFMYKGGARYATTKALIVIIRANRKVHRSKAGATRVAIFHNGFKQSVRGQGGARYATKKTLIVRTRAKRKIHRLRLARLWSQLSIMVLNKAFVGKGGGAYTPPEKHIFI